MPHSAKTQRTSASSRTDHSFAHDAWFIRSSTIATSEIPKTSCEGNLLKIGYRAYCLLAATDPYEACLSTRYQIVACELCCASQQNWAADQQLWVTSTDVAKATSISSQRF